MEAGTDLLCRCYLKKQFQGRLEVLACFLDGFPLTGNIKFRTQCHIAVMFPFDDRCKLSSSWLFTYLSWTDRRLIHKLALFHLDDRHPFDGVVVRAHGDDAGDPGEVFGRGQGLGDLGPVGPPALVMAAVRRK